MGPLINQMTNRFHYNIFFFIYNQTTITSVGPLTYFQIMQFIPS